MPVNIYLLSLTDLRSPELLEAFLKEAPLRVDEVRRRKAEKIRNPRGRAASLGAGLLLQKMAADYQRGIKNSIENGTENSLENCVETAMEMQNERLSAAEEKLAAEGQYTAGEQRCTVRQQCYAAGELLTALSNQASPAENGRPSRQAPLPLEYRFGPHGKPEIIDFPMNFSLSHSGDYVLCAFSEKEVGADIQQLQPLDYLKLAGRFFTKAEYEALKGCCSEAEKQRLFFGLWTRKEARGKLSGQGVAGVLGRDVGLNTESFGDGKSGEGLSEEETAPERGSRLEGACPEWLEIPVPEGYAAAVCVLK